MKTNIRSLNRDDLADWLARKGYPSYRCDQVLRWLYSQRVSTWDEMGNLPKGLRAAMGEEFAVEVPQMVQQQGSLDTTKKYLWRLGDGAFVESVLIPANPGQAGDSSERKTLCVSSQVGCAYGCKFCASGLDGWKRNLTVDEIVGQIIAAENQIENDLAGDSSSAGPDARDKATRHIDNLVFMGMGEPLANYPQLSQALKILNAEWGAGIGARRITISTSGLVPQIKMLADEPAQFRLAISLHGSTDEVRNRIMPVNKRFPLADLTEACDYYINKKGKMITLEYILIEGINDHLALTDSLADLALRLRAKVNLIPYNTVDGLEWRRPSESQQEAFFRSVRQKGVTVTLRREKGHDIDAACGQLRLKAEKGLGEKS